MSDQNKQQLGDGSDNYIQAAQKASEAAKQLGQATAQKTSEKGVEAATTAAAHTVKAGIESGKAVSEIAAGTAAGGPAGAILSTVWAMRHTIFKLLICIILMLVFFICAIVSLPSIVTNNIFRTDPESVDMDGSTDMFSIYDDLVMVVSDCVSAGYDYALAEVERIIADGGYDYRYSMEALVNYGQTSADYDVCYVLAAYSASLEQRGTTKRDMERKLKAVANKMFSVSYITKQTTITVPAENPDDEPTIEEITFVECTIHPFDQTVIAEAFGIDLETPYSQFSISTGTAIANMSNALKISLYGTVGSGSIPPISDAELMTFLSQLDCSPARKELIRAGLSLVGRIPYFWGGKSAAGWNPEWNTPKLVTAAGSSSSGTIRPYGLDCSGFTDWVYKTAIGKSLGSGGTSNQWYNSTPIAKSELLPGDLGFLAEPGTVDVNHVLIYAGKSVDGTMLWVHCEGGTGVILNSPNYVKYYRRVKGIDLEGGIFPGQGGVNSEPLYSVWVDVTHYCACSKCCGIGAKGITASGKQVAPGMVAMSSYYEFGTQIMINGNLYTVEDRGASGIENDISRVDIYVPSHQEALRLGRYKTEAYIYRIGR